MDKQSFSLPLSLGLQNQEEVLAMMSRGVNHHAQHNVKSFLVGETEAQRHEASCLGLHRLMVLEARQALKLFSHWIYSPPA